MIPSGTARWAWSSPRAEVVMRPVFVRGLAVCILGPVAVAAAIVIPVRDAGAAVRVCRSAVSGAVGEAKTEREAKRLALESWAARAGQNGTAYTSWRLANNKRLACRTGGNGSVRCQATANPCALAQNPRLQRPKPVRNKSRGIEI
jgi:hypothetical protein